MSEAKRPAITPEERERLRALADRSPTLILTGVPLAALLDENEDIRREAVALRGFLTMATTTIADLAPYPPEVAEAVLAIENICRAAIAAGSDSVKGAP